MTATRIPCLAALTAIALGWSGAPAVAQSNSKGRNSPVVVGTVVSVDDGVVVVRQKGEDQPRRLTQNEATKVEFVGFEGIGKSIDTPRKGIGIKAKVGAGDALRSAVFTPSLPAGLDAEGRHELTEAELFRKADRNGNERVDYVEFSIVVHRSEKHGPDHFRKVDRNGDDVLDVAEFARALEAVDWWRLSRKSPEKWLRTCDEDNDGSLSKREFATVCQSGSHLDRIFERADEDESGTLSIDELEDYLGKSISPNRKSSRSKKV